MDKSIQTTRRFDALKLWLTLRIMGADAIGDLFDDAIDLAAEVGAILATDPEFELAAEPQLSTLVFRYRPLNRTAAACLTTPRTASTRTSVPPSLPPARPSWPAPRWRPALPEVHAAQCEAGVADIRGILELLRTTGASLLAAAGVSA